ncbi:MAG: alpha/beta hydrolase [Chloroflexi bacterium]|nr:alpha/beta hydrolase [Chloroflexota bacterium]
MPTVDYSPLDRPEISMNSFYPRKNWTPTPPGAEDHMVKVDDGVSLSCRFFPVGPESPTILFFYGNGETAADYDGIAPIYNQVGINFFVADYRGYGGSGGLPAFSTMLSDARKVQEALWEILEAGGYNGPRFVMSRSMGRHAAFELAADPPEGLKGLIIESGRPSLGNFTRGLEPAESQKFQDEYLEKVLSIEIPVLVIHGQMDDLAPLKDAVGMYQRFVSSDKHLLIIPGAGHNDLMHIGINEYFEAIRQFVAPKAES